MSRTVPSPIAAAVGVVPTVVEGVRRLPDRAVHLPFVALGLALAGLGRARREYDELAERGERLLGQLLREGPSVFDPRRVDEPGYAVPETVPETDLDAELDAALDAELDAELPKGRPTPKAPRTPRPRVDTAADRSAAMTADRVSHEVKTATVPHDELPLPDFDHMTLGSLRGRLRALDTAQLVIIRDYEKAHANRQRLDRAGTGAAEPGAGRVQSESDDRRAEDQPADRWRPDESELAPVDWLILQAAVSR